MNQIIVHSESYSRSHWNSFPGRKATEDPTISNPLSYHSSSQSLCAKPHRHPCLSQAHRALLFQDSSTACFLFAPDLRRSLLQCHLPRETFSDRWIKNSIPFHSSVFSHCLCFFILCYLQHLHVLLLSVSPTQMEAQ